MLRTTDRRAALRATAHSIAPDADSSGRLPIAAIPDGPLGPAKPRISNGETWKRIMNDPIYESTLSSGVFITAINNCRRDGVHVRELCVA